jgi:hypothetical protein
VWSGKPQLPCSQRLRLHGLTSCDLRLGTWDLCEVVNTNFHALNGWDYMNGPHVTRDLGHGTPCEVVSPNFHALNGWDCMDWPHVTWGLGPMWSGKSQLPCSQRSRLHEWTSCDLRLRIWGSVWSGKPQLPCSQRLRLHNLTSCDWRLRTWNPVWTGPYVNLGPVHTMTKLWEEKRLDQWKCINAILLAFTLEVEVQRTSPPKEPRWHHF